jgi:2-oxoglutarate dehydrogenase complex dehydrogenase (E1) component-like enzyme
MMPGVHNTRTASTATGSHTIHQMEQRRLIKEAFSE